MKIYVINVDTFDFLGTVTTKYNNRNTLIDNVFRWLKRHPEYKYVNSTDLERYGVDWDARYFYVKTK